MTSKSMTKTYHLESRVEFKIEAESEAEARKVLNDWANEVIDMNTDHRIEGFTIVLEEAFAVEEPAGEGWAAFALEDSDGIEHFGIAVAVGSLQVRTYGTTIEDNKLVPTMESVEITSFEIDMLEDGLLFYATGFDITGSPIREKGKPLLEGEPVFATLKLRALLDKASAGAKVTILGRNVIRINDTNGGNN